MPNKFKPMKARFRATFAGNSTDSRIGNVDAENEILHDVQITLEGEALGHGVWLDREFCEAVAAAGNATGDVGLKVRYGHPSMCADAIGTELGRATNFRVCNVTRKCEDGSEVVAAGVIADVAILKSAHSAPQGDIAAHVLATAAEDPKQFGQSIVFTYADWVVKDADGVRHSYRAEVEEGLEDGEGGGVEGDGTDGEDGSGDSGTGGPKKKTPAEWKAQSADGREYAVLGKLHGTDFTDTPAATDGIFSTNTLAEEAVTMLDEHPQILEAIEHSPKSVMEFLSRTGLDRFIESARLSGLQAAKDKEIATLKADMESADRHFTEALAQAIDEKNAAEVLAHANDEKIAEFETQLAEKDKALGIVKSEAEHLASELREAQKALAESQASLAAEVQRYRDQVGIAFAHPEATNTNTAKAKTLGASVRVVAD